MIIRGFSYKSIEGISEQEYVWILENGFDLNQILRKTRCKNTRKKFKGSLSNVVVACIEKPRPHVLWWYKHSRVAPRPSRKPLEAASVLNSY